MKVLFLEHDHVSPPGPVAQRFAERGYEVVESLVVPEESFHSPNVEFAFPNPSDFDAIVVMGAPWGAWDTDRIGNWLDTEAQWLSEADTAGVPVLGICFGGQMLARAHGGSVAPGPKTEIGWSTVMSKVPALDGRWFQFHYDSFVPPTNATLLAANSSAPQAFALRKNLALQFHPEVTAGTLNDWLALGGQSQVEKDGQDPQFLLEHTKSLDPESVVRAHGLVDYFIENYVEENSTNVG
jgi:GMP synthase-like glutamine amidotransferase